MTNRLRGRFSVQLAENEKKAEITRNRLKTKESGKLLATPCFVFALRKKATFSRHRLSGSADPKKTWKCNVAAEESFFNRVTSAVLRKNKNMDATNLKKIHRYRKSDPRGLSGIALAAVVAVKFGLILACSMGSDLIVLCLSKMFL